ncbi:winged helix DNA-binding domain-containing protein [Pseudonocardia sp. GCM10023141]|uniref:winged helix DNA-binding domain-containing protein n=1 Tax=Pseudonocardia sp. GCM10023141 TaxID=3252653 RepID=UPI00361B5EA3
MTVDRLRRLRAAAQLLHRWEPRAPVEVVHRLLAVQAQDLRAAMLAVRARSRGATAADVARALTDDRSLVVTWLCRGTLHLVGRAEYPWLLGLTAPAQLTTSRRRLTEEGFPPDAADAAVTAIEGVLAEQGPLTRPAIVAALAGRGIVAAGQAAPHLLRLASLRGIVVQGPIVDGGHAFVLVRDWLGAPPAALADRTATLAELALRYLRGHGPASDADLAMWSGLPLRDVRAGLAAARDRIVDAGSGLVDVAGRDEDAGAGPPRLLPAFDPYLLGWRDRGVVVPEQRRRDVHPGGGMLRAVAIVDGIAIGTWSRPRGEIVIAPFDAVEPGVEAALAVDAADVLRFERLGFSRGLPVR